MRMIHLIRSDDAGSSAQKEENVMMAVALIQGMLYSGIAIALFVGAVVMVMGMAAEK